MGSRPRPPPYLQDLRRFSSNVCHGRRICSPSHRTPCNDRNPLQREKRCRFRGRHRIRPFPCCIDDTLDASGLPPFKSRGHTGDRHGSTYHSDCAPSGDEGTQVPGTVRATGVAPRPAMTRQRVRRRERPSPSEIDRRPVGGRSGGVGGSAGDDFVIGVPSAAAIVVAPPPGARSRVCAPGAGGDRCRRVRPGDRGGRRRTRADRLTTTDRSSRAPFDGTRIADRTVPSVGG